MGGTPTFNQRAHLAIRIPTRDSPRADWRGLNNPVLQQTVDPTFQQYLQASGQQGLAYAQSGLYERLRSRMLDDGSIDLSLMIVSFCATSAS
jgi:hypothetical protein